VVQTWVPYTATRDQIRAAVLGIVQAMTFTVPIGGSTTWRLTGDRLKLWGDVDPSLQPAAYVVEHAEQYEQRGLGLPRRRQLFRVICYSRTDDPGIDGGSDLNTMMESFDTYFAIDAPGTANLTLNGLTIWTRIEGRIFKDPGDIDNQAMLIVPIVAEIP
jgi:hypothetical protein